MSWTDIRKGSVSFVVRFLILYLVLELLYFVYMNGWVGATYLFSQFWGFIGAIFIMYLMTKFFRSNTGSKIAAKIPWWMGGPILRWWFKPRPRLEEGAIRAWVYLLQKMRRNKVTAKCIVDLLKLRDPTLPDELPFVFKELRVELFALMNFMLRHEVWTAKGNTEKKLMELVKSVEGVLSNSLSTPQSVNENMKVYIEGSEIIQQGGKWVLENEQKGVGFARQYYKIHQIMEMFKVMLENELHNEHPGGAESTRINDWADDQQKTFLAPHIQHITNIYDNYKTAVKRFKVVNYVKATNLFFLDMYNMYGQYVRGYNFAKRDAKPDYYNYALEPGNDGDNGIQRSIDWNLVVYHHSETGNVINYEPGTNYLVETDYYGYSTSDINAIQIGRVNLPYIRRYKKKDIGHLHMRLEDRPAGQPPLFSEVLELTHKDWEYARRDMEQGIFHPFSRGIADYEIISTLFGSPIASYMNFSKATFKKELTIKETAFDREALKNPCKFIYWGKKQYYHDQPDSLLADPKNPYPTLSILGLWEFIRLIADKRVKEPELAERFLTQYFQMQYEFIERSKEGKPRE